MTAEAGPDEDRFALVANLDIVNAAYMGCPAPECASRSESLCVASVGARLAVPSYSRPHSSPLPPPVAFDHAS